MSDKVGKNTSITLTMEAPKNEEVRTNYSKRRDHVGLSMETCVSSEEDYVYPILNSPAFKKTRALFIGNLRKPINASNLQLYLQQLAKKGGAFYVERAWFNRDRTHGIVLINNEEGAEFIREQLNGSIYPSKEEDELIREEFEVFEKERFEKELKEYEEDPAAANPPLAIRDFSSSVQRLPLYVDYIPVKAINQWIFEEDKGPKDGKWQLKYSEDPEKGIILANHILSNRDSNFVPKYYKGKNLRGGRDAGRQRDNSGGRDTRRESFRKGGKGGNDRERRNNYNSATRRGRNNERTRGKKVAATDTYIPMKSEST